jgi:WD40 repeat protein
MFRRHLNPLAAEVALLLLGTMLGIVSNFAAGGPGNRWEWLVAIGALMVLVVGLQVWQHQAQRAPSRTAVWNADRPPYPGLEEFTEEDAGVFFGREPEITELYSRLHPALPAQAQRLITLVGPSGIGKSSLVRAGLLPRLSRRRNPWTIIPPVVPEDRPVSNLARALGCRPDDLAKAGEAAAMIVARVDELRGTGSSPALLVVDQAEELLTLSAGRDAFLDLLGKVLEKDQRLWVIMILRSEFLTGFLETTYARMFHGPVAVGALSRASLFEVIERPAEQAGLAFDPPGLVQAMVDETGGGDALPLLAYTLQELYLAAGPTGRITTDAYHRLGGVAGALTRQADRVTAELAELDAPVIETLLRFVTIADIEPTRRRVRRATLTPAEATVADAFVSARLVTASAFPDGEAALEVAHEALFRQWAPLRQAIEAEAEHLRHRADLERWARDWERSGREDSYLLRAERLRAAVEWASERTALATELPLVAQFIEASRSVDHAAMVRLADAIAQRALGGVDTDPEHALLLSLTALEECAVTSLVRRSLATALAASGTRGVLRGHDDWVQGVTWSPDGRLLATCSRDGTAAIWASDHAGPIRVLRGHEDAVRAIAWSPDGEALATGSYDRTARIWDARTGEMREVLAAHTGDVLGVAWSPDGTRLATASRDRVVRIFVPGEGGDPMVITGHATPVRAVAWSPDGRILASAGDDRVARLWDGKTGAAMGATRGHTDSVHSLSWSPDGRRLVTGGRDKTVRIWSVPHLRGTACLRGHEDGVTAVAWSPRGHLVASASQDRTVRVWDPTLGGDPLVLRGHADAVTAVAYSPDGNRLATAAYDRTVRLWDPGQSGEVSVLRGHRDTVRSVAWSPDSRGLVSGSQDRTVRIWDADRGTETLRLRGHKNTVRAVAWSPDGKRVAAASFDPLLRVWDASTGGEPKVLRGHSDAVFGLAWSPDGRLASGSRDRTVRIWDLNRSQARVLATHTDELYDVAWSPDGRWIAVASQDRTARVWDAGTGDEVAALRGHTETVWGVAWSRGGRRLATASQDWTVRVWEPLGSAETIVLRGHEDAVRQVAWSPDGTHLATVSLDRTLRVWETSSGDELLVLGIHPGPATSVAWSPDGRRIATGSYEPAVRIWTAITDLATLVERARARVFQDLSAETRQALMLPPHASNAV